MGLLDQERVMGNEVTYVKGSRSKQYLEAKYMDFDERASSFIAADG